MGDLTNNLLGEKTAFLALTATTAINSTKPIVDGLASCGKKIFWSAAAITTAYCCSKIPWGRISRGVLKLTDRFIGCLNGARNDNILRGKNILSQSLELRDTVQDLCKEIGPLSASAVFSDRHEQEELSIVRGRLCAVYRDPTTQEIAGYKERQDLGYPQVYIRHSWLWRVFCEVRACSGLPTSLANGETKEMTPETKSKLLKLQADYRDQFYLGGVPMSHTYFYDQLRSLGRVADPIAEFLEGGEVLVVEYMDLDRRDPVLRERTSVHYEILYRREQFTLNLALAVLAKWFPSLHDQFWANDDPSRLISRIMSIYSSLKWGRSASVKCDLVIFPAVDAKYSSVPVEFKTWVKALDIFITNYLPSEYNSSWRDRIRADTLLYATLKQAVCGGFVNGSPSLDV